ncbi:hypothetical protein [Vibrio vulnificus]|uniref:hypothetical protein n=1 Tax=Vibrio vulnificus TaxID=672 RepID=UPI00057715DD|nr:hypothetical protein [Vibrio vulnificus]ELI0610685.1 hypothetical protein [Vibrio vulnificus]MCA3991245.1 hypothetical protein [Vibrio vulnificus]MCU8271245.1 hypothetical protein [Vibrio vulnificus]RZQ29207.1 hypothetical protein D8T36_05450 [Vibrio vulnificus]RZR38364.1 hypothetical protein D8T59_11430 [Vibrio vulnificus]
MNLIAYQLLRPFAYLKIEHRDKTLYNLWIPIGLSVLTTAFVYLFVPQSQVLSEGGVIDAITSFIGNLPGFFIAALAAIATFNRPTIDNVMGNEPPVIPTYYAGVPSTDIPLTRRHFLCLLFAYLTAVSLVLVIFTKLAIFAELPKSLAFLGSEIRNIGALFYFFVLWQMISATFLGLFYLGDKLHLSE